MTNENREASKDRKLIPPLPEPPPLLIVRAGHPPKMRDVLPLDPKEK
jgi:hypothetical protein